jgi:outer membrane lipase/esterase
MKALITSIALILASASAAANPISAVVSFGDSLSDAGAFGFRATTEPSLAWPQLLAQSYGLSQTANEHVSYTEFARGVAGTIDPSGLNYAEGGARVMAGFGANPEGMPISVFVQFDHFLKQHGRFKPNELVTVYIGTNDILIPILSAMRGNAAALALPQARYDAIRGDVETAARQEGQLIENMLAAGARKIAVLNLYDLGISPAASTPALKAALSGLSDAYDEQLMRVLPNDPRIVPIDTRRWFSELAAEPSRQGFAHPAAEDACLPTAAREQCYQPAHWRSPDASETYIFVGGVHFTGRTGRLLAQFVRHEVESGPSW